MLYHIILHYVMLCYVMLCYIIHLHLKVFVCACTRVGIYVPCIKAVNICYILAIILVMYILFVI